MEPNESVLSDVHLFTDNCNDDVSSCDVTGEFEIVTSRLKFSKYEEYSGDKTIAIDEDGDFDLTRPSIHFVFLQHALSTKLNDVGLQVWNGALLLSDFIIHNSEKWKEETVIELGSGTGLCSIILGMFSKKIFCTDTGEQILKLCQNNVKRNDKLMRAGGEILIRELNWLDENPINVSSGSWTWHLDEVKIVQTVFYVFASDVIYDEDLTDSFFYTIRKLTVSKCFCLYISLEKRLNFTLSELDVAAPAYSHFRNHLNKLKADQCIIKQIQADFPQYFHYDRIKYLVVKIGYSLLPQEVSYLLLQLNVPGFLSKIFH